MEYFPIEWIRSTSHLHYQLNELKNWTIHDHSKRLEHNWITKNTAVRQHEMLSQKCCISYIFCWFVSRWLLAWVPANSLARLLFYSLTCLVVYLLVSSLPYLLSCLLVYFVIYLLAYGFSCLITCLLACFLTCLLAWLID